VKIYDKGVTLNGNGNEHGNGNGNGNGDKKYQMLIGYRTGDMWAPQLDMSEALRVELQQFVRCIERAERPLSDGQSGLRVVRILEAATASIAARGRIVELEPSQVRRVIPILDVKTPHLPGQDVAIAGQDVHVA
jgi:predicted dehydrogenase